MGNVFSDISECGATVSAVYCMAVFKGFRDYCFDFLDEFVHDSDMIVQGMEPCRFLAIVSQILFGLYWMANKLPLEYFLCNTGKTNS